jgi:integrase
MASILKRAGRPQPWSVIWREPETKRQIWKCFATKREAEDFREKVSQAVRTNVYVNPKPKPFKEYATDWLVRKQATVTPNAHGVHRWAVEKHLIPEFGVAPIQSLRPERIERFQAALLRAGTLSARSVQIIRQVLGNILKDARKKGLLAANPMEAVDTIDVPKRELRFLTVEQIAQLCQHAGPMYGTLFALQALCGLRAGEVLALRWADVDLPGGRLSVRRQVVWLRKQDIPDGEPSWRFVEPKSEAGKRVVEIPAPLVKGLEQYREWRNGTVTADALVFSTRDGTPLMQRNIRRRHFQPALKALGLTGIRPHDFRRSFVALHVAAGTHPKLVQTRMGHTNINLTMDVYGRLAGDIALAEEQTSKLDAMARRAIPSFTGMSRSQNGGCCRSGQQ